MKLGAVALFWKAFFWTSSAHTSASQPLSSLFAPFGKRLSQATLQLSNAVNQQLQQPDSPLSAFGEELRQIFTPPTTTTTTTSPTSTTFNPLANMPVHHIQSVDPANPFDFAQLAKETEKFETIYLNGTYVNPDTRLGRLFSGGFGLVSAALKAQQAAALRRPDWAKRRLQEVDSPAPARRLQDLLSSLLGGRRPQLLGRFGLLNAVLGPPPPPGPMPLPVESYAGPIETSRSQMESAVDSLSHEELMAALNGNIASPSLSRTLQNRQLHESGTKESLPSDVMERLKMKYGNDIIVEESDSCFMPGAEIIGSNFLVVRAQDIFVCQRLCAKNPKCKYVTFQGEDLLCFEYLNATGLRPAKHATSGPKWCPGEEPTEPPVGLAADSGNLKRQAEANAHVLRGQQTSSVPAEEEYMEGQQAVPVAAGLLGNLAGLGGLGQSLGGAVSALSAASSVMTTGSQLMQALPLKELAQAGMQLAESGYFRNRGIRGLGLGSGKNKDKTAMPPPPGVGTPSVTCRVEGMTCCIPRQAVQEWQSKPPYLNQYNTGQCRSVYVSAHDEMCATSTYDGDTDEERCGLMLTDTEDLKIYRHILTVPSRTVNNAICECVKKNSADDADEEGFKGSSRWEFSLVAVEQLKQRQDETEQTAHRLARGANAAVALTQLLTKPGSSSNDLSAPSFGGAMNRAGSSALQAPPVGLLPNGGNGPVGNTANAISAIGQAVNLASTLGNTLQRRRLS